MDHEASVSDRLHLLVDAGIALSSELSLDALLQRIVETADDLRLAETLARRAAVAVDLSERVGRDTMRRVVTAQEIERARLARELRDETGQALTSILLGLKGVEQEIGTDEARDALASVRDTMATTLQRVRRLALGIRERAALVGGRVRVGWSADGGTTIAVEVPVR